MKEIATCFCLSKELPCSSILDVGCQNRLNILLSVKKISRKIDCYLINKLFLPSRDSISKHW